MEAFGGVRVLDFSSGIAAPMATMFLADFGAEVLKVEPPGGERMRAHPGYFCWNRNKQVLTLDLATAAGLREARNLLASADVAVFDWAPGEMERSGLESVGLRAADPALIHAWFPPISPTGRWSQLAPIHSLLAAVTGVASLQPAYREQPTYLVTPQLHYGQGLLGAGVLASALLARARTGEGQAVVVSGLHGTAAVESGGMVRTGGMIRMGGRGSRGGIPNYRLYRCADDQWLFLGTLTPGFFLKALEALDLLDLMALEGVGGEFANLLRPDTNGAVIAALDERFRTKTRDEWLAIFEAADVPAAPAGTIEAWFASEAVAATGMRVEVDDPKLGRVVLPGVPVTLEETPGSVRGLPRAVAVEEVPPRASAPPRGTTPPAAGGPLAGIRVLDLGAFIAGTFAGGILANWGADVVKIEPPGGDGFRPYALGFIGYNRGKRGMVMDFKKPGAVEAFLEMAAQADVVLDNYRHGVRERLGIDYAAVSKVNPRIISCSVSGYGRTGPLAAHPSFDPLVQARSGLMDLQGGGDEPVFYQIPVNDTASAMTAAFGIVAALHAREITGRGQEVLTCLANQSVMTLSGELTWVEGRPANAAGGLDLLGTGALNRHYRCADGWILLAAGSTRDFGAVSAALGHPDWAARMTAEQALREPAEGAFALEVAAAFEGIAVQEAIDRLATRGVPVAPALAAAAIFDDPWLLSTGFFEDFEHPQYGAIRGPRLLGEFQGTPSGYARRSPLLGEHSVEVLERYGFTGGRIAELLALGAVVQG